MVQIKPVEYFQSESNMLSYISTMPDNMPVKVGLIFVHAAEGNRLGPHRMFVELAEKLKNCGIISFRFDMRGCGDSEGDSEADNIDTDIEDLRNAINFFVSKYKIKRIFLLGISRGSLVCISALSEHDLPVNGAILLSTPFSGSKVAAKKFNERIKEYLYKLKNPDNLKKLFAGKVHYRQVLNTLVFAINSQKRYHRQNNGFRTRCPLFFIYGSKDPIASDSAGYYSGVCKQYQIPFQLEVIENANHSFFHYLWKEKIMEISDNWLKEKITGDKNANFS